MTWKPPTSGALDDTTWPETLVARAVQSGPAEDRLHGYAALTDVARHYRYSDLIYLAVVGELPDHRASALFHLGLCSFATVSVGESPAHVGVLSRICGGTLASALGAALVVAADQARFKLEHHSVLLAWLANPVGEPPTEFVERACAAARTMCDAATELGVEDCLVRPAMTRDAARIALLYDAGLRQPEQIQAAIVAARVSGLSAEILMTGPRDLGQYPVKLPPFHYVEETP